MISQIALRDEPTSICGLVLSKDCLRIASAVQDLRRAEKTEEILWLGGPPEEWLDRSTSCLGHVRNFGVEFGGFVGRVLVCHDGF